MNFFAPIHLRILLDLLGPEESTKQLLRAHEELEREHFVDGVKLTKEGKAFVDEIIAFCAEKI
jgi:hypothetical protein